MLKDIKIRKGHTYEPPSQPYYKLTFKYDSCTSVTETTKEYVLHHIACECSKADADHLSEFIDQLNPCDTLSAKVLDIADYDDPPRSISVFRIN